ncbi:MBL fold metallo-hydrolase [Flavobacteriales bacterium]|jgi:hydroxyacylglutathione hydrolase|nr:MBL fold metallo-hydrolase [Flavobacteriales bacterium]
MKVEQIYTGCLAQGAYFIQSQGEAAVIDPLREIAPYMDRAERDGVTIKYIFETHFHADFVSGHVTLAEKTGGRIVYGPNAQTSFDSHIAADGEEFRIGDVTIRVLHTPGHTMESTTYLLLDPEGKEHAIFTGDTLFLGDVGRPDLAQKSASLTQEELAGTLFNSLRQKIMPLPDDVTVYPAHGAGSACGKNMMKETVDTLGNQKRMNYALRADMTQEEFVQEVTDGLMPPPPYFPLNVKLNKEGGYAGIDQVLSVGLRSLVPDAFEEAANAASALVLDVRAPEDFAAGHVPNSIFIGLDGNFAPWVGELIVDVQQPILLVAPEGREEEAVTRLARVGFDQTLGFLQGGISAWQAAGKALESVHSISAAQFESEYAANRDRVFDVRKPGEYQSEHIDGAHHAPLSSLNRHLAEFPDTSPFYLHCAGGYRSMIASSMLKARGIHNMIDVQGGYGAISETQIPKTDYVCPSTL